MQVDLLVKVGAFLESPEIDVKKDVALLVKDGRIFDVVSPSELRISGIKASKTLERPFGLVMPGLINAHTHAPMTLFRGVADDLPLATWLEEHIFPREAKLTPGLIELGTELACAEMIRSGTTAFVDMYLFEDAIASVVDRVGMRAWLGEGIFDFATPAFKNGEEALKETERLLSKWQGHNRIVITVDPHTPYTCAQELLQKSVRFASEHGCVLVTHVAETDWEYGFVKGKTALSPVAYLDSLGFLSQNTLAVHSVVLSDDDIDIYAKRGVTAVHCPESNLKLASGISPVPKMISNGITVCLGTDGAASNNDLDMFGEMSTCAKLHKGICKDPTALPAKLVLEMATVNPAKAFGTQGLGILAKGCIADFIVVDLRKPHLTPCSNYLSHLVYAAKGSDVQDVVVAGKLLMEDRNLLTIDEERCLAMAAQLGRQAL